VAVAVLVAGGAGATWLLTRDDEPARAAAATGTSVFGAPAPSSGDEEDDDAGSGATGSAPGPPSSSAPATSAAPTPAPAPASAVPTSGAGPTTPPVLTEAQAEAELRILRAQSLSRLDLDGRWVAQLASKAVGITDPLQVAANGTHTFYAWDILAESQDLAHRASSPAAVSVLTSDDFGKRSHWTDGQPYWVTLVDEGFGSGDEVRLWCARAFPTLSQQQLANACVARTLSRPHD
jgi:hypothetical protein